VSNRIFFYGTDQLPIQKCAIFFKFKEIKELRGGILMYAAQAIPPIDAEIVEKGHFWTETTIHPDRRNTLKSARKQVQHGTETSVAYWSGWPLVYQNSAARHA
jgi:hypothetical protein